VRAAAGVRRKSAGGRRGERGCAPACTRRVERACTRHVERAWPLGHSVLKATRISGNITDLRESALSSSPPWLPTRPTKAGREIVVWSWWNNSGVSEGGSVTRVISWPGARHKSGMLPPFLAIGARHSSTVLTVPERKSKEAKSKGCRAPVLGCHSCPLPSQRAGSSGNPRGKLGVPYRPVTSHESRVTILNAPSA